MLRFLPILAACLVLTRAYATPAPLTVNEMGLMLRTGYSTKAVLDELTKRRFADTLDAAKESQLIKAGAAPELLVALKSGSYTVSPAELAQAQQQKEAETKRRTAAAEEARKFDTLHQANLAQQHAADALRETINGQAIYQQLKGDLVQWRNGSIGHYDDTALQTKKYFLIYFSAHWCGPCRKFTPGLVNYYNDTVAKHPELELVFVSADKSPFGMETYMREMNMPWPAVDFEKTRGKEGIRKYAGKGIPDLVLVDSSGKVLADSYKGDQYLGPESVLQAVNSILTQAPAKQMAQASR
jgi:nucleoredoxin